MKRFSLGDSLFSKLFKIGTGKEYRVAWQWDARKSARFFALKRIHKSLFLACLAALVLGLSMLGGELGFWVYRQVSVEFRLKQNMSLNRELQSVQSEQKSLETNLDGLTEVEEKIRALYGMNSYDRSLLAFGVGGRRPTDPAPYALAVSEQILSSSLKNRQLESKISFTSNSFKQIQEFVRYRHNLWEHTPFILPAKGQVTSGFGIRLHPVTGAFAMHEGMDICNSKWTPIYATADGMVATSQLNGNFGNVVVLDHGNGYTTKYGHLTQIMVQKGQLVKRYGLIGYMGDTGRTTGTHLHYEVHRDGSPQNPEKYILPSGVLVD